MRLLILSILLSLTFTSLPTAAQEPLTQTYTSPGGSLTFNYPEGWIATQNLGRFGVILANSQDTLNLVTPLGVASFGLGQIVVNIVVLPTDEAQKVNISGAGFQSEIIVSERSATRIETRSGETEGTVIIINLENNLSLVTQGSTQVGEFAQFESTLLAIAETIRFQEPASTPQMPVTSLPASLTETYTLADDTLEFDYPNGWIVDANPIFGNVILVNNGVSFDRLLITHEYDPGFVIISINKISDVSSSIFETEASVMIGTRRAFRDDGECPGFFVDNLAGVYFLIDAENEMGWVIQACALVNEIKLVEPLVLAIAETMRVPGSELDTPLDVATSTFLTRSANQLAVRDCPSPNCQQIGVLENIGTLYVVVGENRSRAWLQIDFNGSVGWVCKQSTDLISTDLNITNWELPVTSNSSEDCDGNFVAPQVFAAPTTPSATEASSAVATQPSEVNYSIHNIRSRIAENNGDAFIEFEVWNQGDASSVAATATLTISATNQTIAIQTFPPLQAQESVTVALTVPASLIPIIGGEILRVAVGVGEVETAESATVLDNFAAISLPTSVSETLAPEATLGSLPGATFTPQISNPVVKNDGTVVHIVQPGDTLDAIAVAYGLSRGQIFELNNITNAAGIQVGQELIIDLGSQASNTPPITLTANTSLTPPIATFNDGVNVRSGPGTQFNPPIGAFAAGQTTEILAVNPDRTWYKVRYFSGEGWVAAQFVTVSGDISALPEHTGSETISLTPTPALEPTLPIATNLATNGMIAYVSQERGNAITLLDSQTLQPVELSNALTTTNVRSVKFSPNGRYLAYAVSSERGSSLYVFDMTARVSNLRVELFDGGYDWSPDSRQIVYSQAYDIMGEGNPQGLWLVDVVTGDKREFIAPLTQASLSSPDWSPDGEFIRFVEVGNTVILDYIIARADGTGIVGGISIPHRVGSDWSPDGTQFVFDDEYGYGDLNRSLYIANRDGSGQRTLFQQVGYSAVYPIWSPNGQHIAFWRQSDADRRQSSTWIINPVTGISSEIPNSTNSRPVAWSPDSTRLITIGESGTLIHSINGGEPGLLGVGYEVSWQSNSPSIVEQSEPCRAVLIQIDHSLAEGVVSGNLAGLERCTATVEITNNRPYWVNFSVEYGYPITASPNASAVNFFVNNKVLPPNGSIRYDVTFTGRGQSVIAFVNPTIDSGVAAQNMNRLQALVDAITTLSPLPAGSAFSLAYELAYEAYPELDILVNSLDHLGGAFSALATIPPDYQEFRSQWDLAWQSGEFEILVNGLREMGWTIVEAITPEQMGAFTARLYGLTEVVIRNWSGVLEVLITGKVAGSVVFRSS